MDDDEIELLRKEIETDEKEIPSGDEEDAEQQVTDDGVRATRVMPLSVESVPQNILPEAPPPKILTRVYANYIYLKEFLTDDFNIDNPVMIDLKRKDSKGDQINKGYWFILFMDESSKGREMLQRWLELAQIIKDDYCKLGFCNLTFEHQVLEKFKDLGRIEYTSHPYTWAKFTENNFMMVYRDHWPQGFYNGQVNQKILANFIIEKIANGLVPIEKDHVRREDYQQELYIAEERLEEKELKRKAEEDDKKKQEEIKKINPTEQQVSDGINFLE